MSSWIDSEHVRYHGDPCKFNFCWYRDARAHGTPAPDSVPAGLSAERLAAALDRILGEVIAGRYALLTPTEVANGVFALAAEADND